jgi:signal recognition particle subunit SRP72
LTLFYRELVFEKAYCQYRLNQPQDALKTLNAATSLSLELKELKAQILYRLERYLITGIAAAFVSMKL